MRRFTLPLVALFAVALLAGADGCSSDPNVEGARLYVRQENYAAALERLDTALQTNPDNVDALAMKAEVLRLQAEDTPDVAARRPMIEQMVATLERIESLEPGHAEARQTRLRAWAFEMNAGVPALRAANTDPAQLTRAVGSFEHATLLVPDSTDAYYNLGLAYLIQGNTASAIPALERVTSGAGADAQAFVYLSRAYVSNNRGSDAVTLLERAQTAHPDDAAIRAELLNAYAATGQTDRAMSAYEQAVQREPDNALYRYNYGSTLLQAERLDEAITQLTRAVEIDPNNGNAHYNLGAAYQNRAAGMNAAINAAEGAEQTRLRDERNAQLRLALPHFESARRLATAEGENVRGVCDALFRVYTTLSMLEQAQEASECAQRSAN